MPAAADDEMVVHGDAERRGRLHDVLGDGDVGLGWRRVARRVIVEQATSVYIYLILCEFNQRPNKVRAAIGGGGW
jgi:hypothetical protein